MSKSERKKEGKEGKGEIGEMLGNRKAEMKLKEKGRKVE